MHDEFKVLGHTTVGPMGPENKSGLELQFSTFHTAGT